MNIEQLDIDLRLNSEAGDQQDKDMWGMDQCWLHFKKADALNCNEDALNTKMPSPPPFPLSLMIKFKRALKY